MNTAFLLRVYRRALRSRLRGSGDAVVPVRRLLLGFLLVVCLGMPIARHIPPLLAGSIETSIPRIQRVDLLNGFRLSVVEGKPREKVLVRLLIKSGFVSDPKDKEGLAFLTSRAVCFANQKTSPERLKDELDFLGVQFQTRLDADSTLFEAELPASNVEALLTMLVNVIVHPIFSESGLERLKKELHDSNLSGSKPDESAEIYFQELIFRGGPCAQSQPGKADAFAGFRINDLAEFHRTNYLPNNAVLVLVGVPNSEWISNLVREKFGSWIKKELLPTEPVFSSSLAANKIQIVDHGVSDEAVLILGNSGPSRQTPDFLALTALDLLMGGVGPSSRLETAFRAKNIPYSSLKVESHFGRHCGKFQVAAKLPVDSLRQALQTMLDCLEGLKSEAISESELTLVKSQLKAQYRANLESDTGLAKQVAEIELYDVAKDSLNVFPPSVERLSRERIQEVAKNYRSTTRFAAVVVGNRDKVGAALSGLRTVELFEKGGLIETSTPTSK